MVICIKCERPASEMKLGICEKCWQNLKDEEMAYDEQYCQEE